MHPDPAALTIDLGAIRANWRTLADLVAPGECAAVVKADAYGTGCAQAAPALWREGARTFFVARVSEGVDLRRFLPQARIYVLDGLLGDAARVCLEHDLRPVLGSLPEIEAWVNACAGAPQPAALHLDTGMNRLGLSQGEIEAARPLVARARIELTVSHFTSSERPDAPDSASQIERFRQMLAALGLDRTKTSLANSSGIFLGQKPWFDLVRPGYALYGGNPTPGRPNPMRPVVHLTAPVLRVRDVGAGETVGYNRRWTARRAARIATLALGYADGIPRGAAGENGKAGPDMAVNGRRCPIVGRISMDLITIDVSDCEPGEVSRGTLVEVLGPTIGVDEFGERAGTIGYEILTGLRARAGRRYIHGALE